MNKKDLNAISQKANSLIEEENFEKAIEFLNILNIEDPNNYFLKMNLGACYKKTGNFKKALDIYNSAKELPEKDSELYYNIGNLYFSMKDYKESINFYDMAIKDNSNH